MTLILLEEEEEEEYRSQILKDSFFLTKFRPDI